MRIYPRNGVLYYDFYLPPKPGETRKRRIRKQTAYRPGEEQKALEEGYRALSQLGDKQQQLQQSTEGQSCPFTWGQAVEHYVREKTYDGKLSLDKDEAKFRWMKRNIVGVNELTLDKMTRFWINTNVRDPLRAAGLKKRTINHYLSAIGHVLNLASTEWETEMGKTWIQHPPKVGLEKFSKQERSRIRWLTQQEAEQLATELPDHLGKIYRFALHTGLRAANLRDLTWEQVDLVRNVAWIHPDEAKAGNAIAVPLNSVATRMVRSQIGRHQRYVFTNNHGNHITSDFGTKAWLKALDRCGLRMYRRQDDKRYPFHHFSEYKFDDLTWHDATRHTWATWHVMGGTRIEILQELGGWSSLEMVKRYGHFDPGHIAQFAENVLDGARMSDNIRRRNNR